ncbi:hypothetical protein VIGAN_09208100, partial [Vigna angularis var. angularis]
VDHTRNLCNKAIDKKKVIYHIISYHTEMYSTVRKGFQFSHFRDHSIDLIQFLSRFFAITVFVFYRLYCIKCLFLNVKL